MTGPWVGVDPGATWTGIVVRYGNRLLWHQVLQRVEDEDVVRGVGVGPKYIRAVMHGIGDAIASVIVQCSDEVVEALIDTAPQIAVEGVVPPNPHVRRKDDNSLIDPGPTIGAGMVLGAVLGQYPGSVVIPPAKHGKNLLATYPHGLITPTEMRLGLHRNAGDSADIRHCRSAWDVAGKGQQHAALRSARRPTTGATA